MEQQTASLITIQKALQEIAEEYAFEVKAIKLGCLPRIARYEEKVRRAEVDLMLAKQDVEDLEKDMQRLLALAEEKRLSQTEWFTNPNNWVRKTKENENGN